VIRRLSSRQWAWCAIVAGVLITHAWFGAWLQDTLAGWGDARNPQVVRMDVAFVKELAPAAPPTPAAAAAAPPRAAPTKLRAPRQAAPSPELAASAPEPAASAPIDTPAPDVAQATPEPPAASQSAASEPAAEPVAAPTAVAQAASAPSTSAASFDWPPSTRLTYTLLGNYRGEVHGTARVQWVRRGERYQVHLDVFIGPSFAPLISRRMTSDGVLSNDGLTPQRYEELTKLPFQSPRQVRMTFEPGVVTLANGQTRDAIAGVQDTASQFVHLAWLFTAKPQELRVGNAITVPLALPRRMDQWIYDVVGQEPLSTPVGVIDTFHLKPRRAQARPKGELSAEIWFAPSLQYLPVRIRMQQDADTYADLLLDSAPLQAEPQEAQR
jgi:Protein of unknown function (DUF3108)